MNKLGKLILCILAVVTVSGCDTTSVRDGLSLIGSGSSGNVAALEALKQPDKNGIKVEVEANAGGKYRTGDPIRFKITSAKEGKLWIVAVNNENNAELLFPHGQDDENTVEAGQENMFPPRDSKRVLYADKPYGRTALAFIITAKGTELRDIVSLKNGELRNVSFGSDTQWGVAKLSISVEK